MVKELDLFESNHGCGLNAPSHAKRPKTAVTQRYTVQNWCVTSSQGRSDRVAASTHGFSTFEYFDLTGKAGRVPPHRGFALLVRPGCNECPFLALHALP